LKQSTLKTVLLVLALSVVSACSLFQPQPEQILVGGATGRQGNAVVDELLERGYRVRALTRKPDSKKAQALAQKGVQIVVGNYNDEASLRAAMQGIDRMFFYSDFSAREVAEAQNVINIAQQSGLTQVVYSSGAAAEPGIGVPNSAKMQVEEALVASGVPYTVFRPVAFMENYDGMQAAIARKGIVESRGPDRVLSFIAISDIGFFVGEAFDYPDEWTGRAVNIAGDAMTVEEYIATFSRVMDREITYTRMPLDEYLQTMPRGLRPLFRWYDEVGYEADVAAYRASYPNLITLEEYLRATGWENWQPDNSE